MSREEEEDENAAELKLGENFSNANCLMNDEVALILQHRLQQMNNTTVVPRVFEKSLQYVQKFGRYKSREAVREVREILSGRYQLGEFEVAVLGNLCPETVEEAIAMVPSLKDKDRRIDHDVVGNMINDLAVVKRFQ